MMNNKKNCSDYLEMVKKKRRDTRCNAVVKTKQSCLTLLFTLTAETFRRMIINTSFIMI